MKVQIKKIDPMRAAIISAALYSIFAVIAFVFMLGAALFARGGPSIMGLIMAFIMPLIYIITGFVGGLVGAFVYNFIIRWTGGILLTLELEEVPAEAKPVSV